jgi:molybdopterin-binding protein
VHVAYRPDDVVLAAHGTSGVSSERNRLDLHVAAITPAGGLVRVRLTGAVQLVALVTRASADALGLAPGTPIQARLKATALRVFPAP